MSKSFKILLTHISWIQSACIRQQGNVFPDRGDFSGSFLRAHLNETNIADVPEDQISKFNITNFQDHSSVTSEETNLLPGFNKKVPYV